MENTSDSFMPGPLLFCMKIERSVCYKVTDNTLLSFIKTDNVYHKYYDDVLILLKTGLRISELCGLTIMDVDFIHEVVVIDHQLLKSKEQGYYIETPKTIMVS